MLGDYQPIATLAVTDLDAAREFYEGVLGFVPRREVAEGVLYAAGTGDFLVYPSSFAGTNQATALSFQVPADRFDAEAAAPREKGLVFQTFEAEGLAWVDSVASYGEVRSAWFSDPDGNILNIETGT